MSARRMGATAGRLLVVVCGAGSPSASGLLGAAAVSAWPAAVMAQTPPTPPPSDALPRSSDIDWTGDFAVLSANALVGGLTAGLIQELRGGSFQDGFARGALGGAVVYTGKRVAAARFDGAGFLGREVAAVGTSIVRNAADARPSLERLLFSVGPVNLYVATGADPGVRAKLNAATLLVIGYAIIEPGFDFDLGSSLSTGAPVFRARDRVIEVAGETWAGIQTSGNILLSDSRARTDGRVLAHERIHVLQYDQVLYTWVDPAEGWLLDRLPGGEHVARFIDLGLNPVGPALTLVIRDWNDRPWEMEAVYLTRQNAGAPVLVPDER